MNHLSIFFFQRNGKTSACNVNKIVDANNIRPERLISRIRINSVDENAPRLQALRSPKGPDGTKGFHASSRNPRIIGMLYKVQK